jgi:NADPH2:quinone reductase
MVKAMVVHEHGGPEAMRWEDVEVGDPGPGEARIKHEAIGLNFVDVYFRKGLYKPAGGLPYIPGNEGAGTVVAVGPGVTHVKRGDRV